MEAKDVTCDVIDPFDEAAQAFITWLRENQEKVREYEKELQSYCGLVPDFVKKSADKLIVEVLDKYNEMGIEKPGITFLAVLRDLKSKLTTKYEMVDIMHDRVTDDIDLLEIWKTGSTEDKKVAKHILVERGWF